MADVESPNSLLIGGMLGRLGASRACVMRWDPLTGEFGAGRLLRPYAISEWSTYAEALALDHCDDGGVALSGGFFGNLDGSCISKMDSSLNPIWEHGWSNFNARSLAGLADGSVVAAGDSVVARFLPSGLVDWSMELVVGNGGIRAMQVRPDGHILLAGWSEPTDPYGWLILLDPTGTEVWARRYGNTGDGFQITGLHCLANGDLRLSGRAGNDALLIATDDQGHAGSCSYLSLLHSLAPMTLLAVQDPTSQSFGIGPVDSARCTGVVAYVQNTIACAGNVPWVASGQVYNDLNLNGAHDPGEPGLPYSGVSITPNAGYTFSLGQGDYEFRPSAASTFFINSVSLGPWWQYTQGAAGYTVPFTAIDTVFTGLDFGFAPFIDTTNFVATLYTAAGPCGTAINQTFDLINAGTSTPQGVVGLTLDPLFSFAGSDQAPDSIIGNTYYWSFDSLGWFEEFTQTLQVLLPDASHMGESTLNSLNVWADDGNGVLSLVQTSQGYVVFRLKPLPVTSQLTTISNNAGIYFDLNPPVITKSVRNTLVDCALTNWPVTIEENGSFLFSATYWMDTTQYSYQWWLNGATLTGATEPFFEAQENGDYSVALTDPYGCTMISDPVSVIVTSVQGEERPMLGVMPNPSKDAFVLTSSQRLESHDRVSIIDVSGRVVRTMLGTGSARLAIPREGLTSGIYVVRVLRTDMSTGAVRVVLE